MFYWVQVARGLLTEAIIKPKIELGKTKSPRPEKFDDQNVNGELFEILRDLRKTLADKESLPPYVIFPDTTLKEMSVYYPGSLESLANISGVGEVKLQKYGDKFLKTIALYCGENGIEPKEIASKYQIGKRRSSFRHGLRYFEPFGLTHGGRLDSESRRISGRSFENGSTVKETLKLYEQGLTLEEMAKRRSFAVSTIVSHLEKLILSGKDIDINRFVSSEDQKQIERAINEVGPEMLNPIKAQLGDKFSYEQIKLVRAKILKKS
jgi:ATP-dependent DNA helicase RecQ